MTAVFCFQAWSVSEPSHSSHGNWLALFSFGSHKVCSQDKWLMCTVKCIHNSQLWIMLHVNKQMHTAGFVKDLAKFTLCSTFFGLILTDFFLNILHWLYFVSGDWNWEEKKIKHAHMVVIQKLSFGIVCLFGLGWSKLQCYKF